MHEFIKSYIYILIWESWKEIKSEYWKIKDEKQRSLVENDVDIAN